MAIPFALEDPGLFIIFGLVNMGVTLPDLESSIETEIDKVKTEAISDLEFKKLQNKVENDFVTTNSTMAGIAENLANYQVYYGDANLINNEIGRFMKVTREDLKRVADKYLNKGNRVVLYYLPKPTAQN